MHYFTVQLLWLILHIICFTTGGELRNRSNPSRHPPYIHHGLIDKAKRCRRQTSRSSRSLSSSLNLSCHAFVRLQRIFLSLSDLTNGIKTNKMEQMIRWEWCSWQSHLCWRKWLDRTRVGWSDSDHGDLGRHDAIQGGASHMPTNYYYYTCRAFNYC